MLIISPPLNNAGMQQNAAVTNNNRSSPPHYNDNQVAPNSSSFTSAPRRSVNVGHNLSRALHPQLDKIVAALTARSDARQVTYYTPADVAQHARLDSLWLSALGVVYDLTPFIRKSTAAAVSQRYWAPIYEFAGRDISHWFDLATGDLRTRRDPITNLVTPLCPDGVFIGASIVAPTTLFDLDHWQPWWRARDLMVGLLTAKPREILVYNMLTTQQRHVQVCFEDTVRNIASRVRDWNAHIDSYTWKYLGRNLDMNETLEQNGIPDEENAFYDLGLVHATDDAEQHWMPRLMLYFNDDLTQK